MTYEEFTIWVTEQIFDNSIEDDVFCELACRKLSEMGIVEKTDTEWKFTAPFK